MQPTTDEGKPISPGRVRAVQVGLYPRSSVVWPEL